MEINNKKNDIPIVAVAVHNIEVYDPAEISGLLSDKDLIQDLVVGLDNLKSSQEVAYLLVFQDHEQETNYPAYSKQSEVVFPPKKKSKEEVELKYCKTAEYDSSSFEVQFDDQGFPVSIIIDIKIN